MTTENVSRRAFVAIPAVTAAAIAVAVGHPAPAHAEEALVIECMADLLGVQ
jgi:hypothetical protein